MFLSAWLPVHSSTETPSKGSLRTGLLWGPKGIPGLEERRAEWLTTSNFCFSMGLGWAGLGWGIFPCHKISSTPLRNLSFFFFFHFVVSLLILSEEPGLRLLWDVQKVAVPGSDADKPVGRGGACR